MEVMKRVFRGPEKYRPLLELAYVGNRPFVDKMWQSGWTEARWFVVTGTVMPALFMYAGYKAHNEENYRASPNRGYAKYFLQHDKEWMKKNHFDTLF